MRFFPLPCSLASLGLAFLACFGPAPRAEAAAGDARLVLASDGRAKAVVVLPNDDAAAREGVARTKKQNRSHPASAAARELVHYLEAATGAHFEMVAEAKAASSPAAVKIFVGGCAANTPLTKDKPLQPEEFAIRTEPGALHLLGGDTNESGPDVTGTLYAVQVFLEDYLGVRWLFPGDLGEVVPKHATLEIPAIDRREQPPVPKRKIRDVSLSRESVYAPILQSWGVKMEDWKKAFAPDDYGLWFERQRLGSRIEVAYGHSYAGWLEKYGKEHPDWFALQPDGTRNQVPVRERLCVSNPALWDAVARERIAELKANPKQQSVSISPNDGGANKFCMCERCRTWDPPNAPKLENNAGLIDPATKQPFAEYPSLSDRYFRYYNEVAKRIGAEMPDRLVGCYAYSVYRTPPVSVKQLEPNLVVAYVGLDPGAIEAWSKVAPKLFIRPNDLGPMPDLGLPRNRAVWLAQAVKFALDHHAVGFDFDNCQGNWGEHGLEYYVLAQALWNPNLDVRATIADYCRAAYGPAAEVMQKYYDRLEKVSDQVRGDDLLSARGTAPERLLLHYTPAVLSALEGCVAEAHLKLGTDHPKEQARVALVEDSLQHARLLTALLATVGKSKAEQQKQYDAVVEFLKGKVLTPSVASLHTLRYIKSALGRAKREVE